MNGNGPGGTVMVDGDPGVSQPVGPWPCSTCGAPGVKNLGTRGYCVAHLAEFYLHRISPEAWLSCGGGVGLPLNAIGTDGYAPLKCAACAAGWTGPAFEVCYWCRRALDHQRADERAVLLDPPWLRTSTGDPRYDALSAADRAVWDSTRGQRRSEGSLTAWAERLGRAVKSGFIDRAAAEADLTRAERHL